MATSISSKLSSKLLHILHSEGYATALSKAIRSKPIQDISPNASQIAEELYAAGADVDTPLKSLGSLESLDKPKRSIRQFCEEEPSYQEFKAIFQKPRATKSLESDQTLKALKEALRHAIDNSNEQSSLSLIEKLLENNVDLNSIEVGHGGNLLHDVVIRFEDTQQQVLKTLLKEKINVNAHGNKGMTPLMKAAQIGNIHAVNLLLKANADPNLKTPKGGFTACYYAVENITKKEEKDRLIKMLYEAGADINHPDLKKLYNQEYGKAAFEELINPTKQVGLSNPPVHDARISSPLLKGASLMVATATLLLIIRHRLKKQHTLNKLREQLSALRKDLDNNVINKAKYKAEYTKLTAGLSSADLQKIGENSSILGCS